MTHSKHMKCCKTNQIKALKTPLEIKEGITQNPLGNPRLRAHTVFKLLHRTLHVQYNALKDAGGLPSSSHSSRGRGALSLHRGSSQDVVLVLWLNGNKQHNKIIQQQEVNLSYQSTAGAPERMNKN